MNARAQFLVTVVLVAAGLWAYDALKAHPREEADTLDATALETSALEARLEQMEAQLRAIEDRLVPVREPATEAGDAPPEKTGPLDQAELARLEAVVRELRRRDEIRQFTLSVRSRVNALGLGFTEAETAQAEALLVALEAERADFWRQVKQAALRDPQVIAERFAPIRERYENALRKAFPKAKASALIRAYLPD